MKPLFILGYTLKYIGVVGAILIGLFSLRFYAGVLRIVEWQDGGVKDFNRPWVEHSYGIYIHISGAILCLLLGPFQFFPSIRMKNRMIHKVFGYIYGVCIVVGAVGAFCLIPYTSTGLPGGMGITLLAIGWLFTLAVAIFYIKKRKIALHREWMIRNFSLTFAAVTLRAELFILAAFTDFLNAYTTVFWLCWVPNILVAEAYIQYSRTLNSTDSSKSTQDPEVEKL